MLKENYIMHLTNKKQISMVSKRKKHKNAQIRAARRRKREHEQLKRWYERQKQWRTKDRIYFYLQVVIFIAIVIATIWILSDFVKKSLQTIF